jgi:alcohol dehydrogenase class IV
MEFTLAYPAKIVFGRGCIQQLARSVRAFGSTALVVTGKRGLRSAGLQGGILGHLEANGIAARLFAEVESDPSLGTVERGVAAATAHGVDVVVGIGGGSALDAAKAVAIAVTQPESVRAYHAGREIQRDGLPFIAVPTTAGTGAEITRNAVLTDERRKLKLSLRGERMIAKVALLDPELTVSLPPEMTAHSGMDALTQAIEAYLTREPNPVSDALALRACEVIHRNLATAVANGTDLPAREAMLLGSLLSALAFSNSGLGAVHGLAHPLGARLGIPHGLACAVLLPHVMELNLGVRRQRLAELAACFGRSQAEEALAEAKSLLTAVGIPASLRNRGLAEELFPTLIAESRGSSMSKNPCDPTDEDLWRILERLCAE